MQAVLGENLESCGPMLALPQQGGASLPPHLAKNLGQFHYKIAPFPDTWAEHFEI